MTTQEPSDPESLFRLDRLVVGFFAVIGLGLVSAAVVGIARGGAIDAFAALAVSGFLLAVFAVHLHRLEPDDDEEEKEEDASPRVSVEPAQSEHQRFWQPTFVGVIGYAFVGFGSYFVVREWQDYPPWFAATFVGVVLLLLLLRSWISSFRAARKSRNDPHEPDAPLTAEP
ncbi:hypothetical protein ASF54_04395 [Frondihabitans sp. Leaf304]|nr:hypothetical protein ASF54_04395 [Frondihabitans sp. Leaf304]